MNELDDMQKWQGDRPKIQERLDQISMFLHFIETNSSPRNMLVGKEKSIGHIKEEHMDGHIEMDNMIMIFLDAGQMKTAIKKIYSVISEFKMTMSIDGEFINNVTKQELRYTQYQHLIQHDDREKKRSFWGGKKRDKYVDGS